MDENKAMEELQFIRKIIEETKHNVMHNGKDYIFWGVLVIIGMLSQYILILNKIYFRYFWIWVVLIPIGWAFSIINRKRKRQNTHQHTREKL